MHAQTNFVKLRRQQTYTTAGYLHAWFLGCTLAGELDGTLLKMPTIILRRFPLFLTALFALVIHSAVFAQADLFGRLFWQAYGTRDGSQWGGSGLDTLGRINDTIRHAISIAEVSEASGNPYVASYVYLRQKLDTIRHFEFPGRDVLRGEINGDNYLDAVVVDPREHKIRVLLGTSVVDSFVVASEIDGNVYPASKSTNTIVLVDCDGDGLDDLVISDYNHQDSNGVRVGRLIFFRGGTDWSRSPTEVITGRAAYDQWLRGPLLVGKFLDTSQRFLALASGIGPGAPNLLPDSLLILLYPIGKGFHFTSTDTILCAVDTNRYWPISNFTAIYALDVTGDHIDDILFAGTDKDFGPSHKSDPTVLVYPGAAPNATLPAFFLHAPDPSMTSHLFGSCILDMGNVTGRGYHSLLVTDPGALINQTGAVFLFNIGSALKDSCVAMASGPRGSFDALGITAISPGDLTDDGRNEIMVGGNVEPSAYGHRVGTVRVFLGDSLYGPEVSSVHEYRPNPAQLSLDQNYPNPVSTTTDISFEIYNAVPSAAEVTLKLYDILGNECATLYHGVADGYKTTVRIQTQRLPQGTYIYRLAAGEHVVSRIMSVLH